MEIQDAAAPSGGWPGSNGFCPSSEWGERWLQYTQSFLEQTHVDGSSCDYCWIIATMASRPEKSIGCQAHNHTHAPGAGQWENLQWWINLTLRNFELPKAWQPAMCVCKLQCVSTSPDCSRHSQSVRATR
jgi:hypothetical protein